MQLVVLSPDPLLLTGATRDRTRRCCGRESAGIDAGLFPHEHPQSPLHPPLTPVFDMNVPCTVEPLTPLKLVCLI